jgi:hypothetical protein
MVEGKVGVGGVLSNVGVEEYQFARHLCRFSVKVVCIYCVLHRALPLKVFESRS